MTRGWRAAAIASAVLVASVSTGTQSRPQTSAAGALTLRLHPENPHYFLFRGRPTVVITSGEHYGAVLNLDFGYRRYFATLAADRLNGARIFSGTYVETGGNFGIAANTLDPAPGRFISPWARSATPGYADGGNKFDLTRFDDAYVARLRAVLQAASEHGIIVELVLFCPLYEESMWAVSPMNPANNVNGGPSIGRADVLTLDEARGKARDELSAVAHGRDPQAARQAAKGHITLKVFIDDHLEPWKVEHHKRGPETIQRLRSVFADLLDHQLADLTPWTVE
jgi:hypothetical protein